MEATSCERCHSLIASRTQIVPPTWSPTCRILCVGEAPGADEDRIGEGFVGAAGKRLSQLFSEHAFVRGRDYGVANIVRCRPEGNRKPTAAETANCLPKLANLIMATSPRVILTVGSTASALFLGGGSLMLHSERSRTAATIHFGPLTLVHPALRPALEALHSLTVIPTVHTSGLSWNRRAPDGRQWSEIGREQIARAVAMAET